MYHGRNLDYPHPVLRNLTVNIIFLKKGKVQYVFRAFKNSGFCSPFLDCRVPNWSIKFSKKIVAWCHGVQGTIWTFIADTALQVAYRGTTFAGYVGLWTGQSPNKFTVSGDQRGKAHSLVVIIFVQGLNSPIFLCLFVCTFVYYHQAMKSGGTGGRIWCPLSSFGDPQPAGWCGRSVC